MAVFLDFQLPLSDPVQVFTVILLIILLIPLLFTRFRIPSVVGLILAGTLVGPHGLYVLEQTETTLFGTVGLLYIMFVAGLEIDLGDFRRNRQRSLMFGALTFTIPLVLGTVVSYYGLQYPLRSSFLLASMFATHTLIAYPIASRLGIIRNEAVTITVGGTMITDTAALIILVVITASVNGELNALFWIKMIASVGLFTTIVLWGFPLVGRWFFRYVEQDGVVQYIFVLTMVFLAAFLAEVAGLEPIIGAFLAGLALNRLVPHNSALMSRIEFIGTALFIPFFLIKVGMLVDPAVIFEGPQAIFVAATLTVVALSSKWVAAYLAQRAFGFSVPQRNLIFGLSSAHAAATIAIILIAYNLGLLDDNVLNGTVLLILITCLVSSFVTDRAGRQLAIQEPVPVAMIKQPEKILVPLANPANMEQLIDLAMMIASSPEETPIYPLSVVADDDSTKETIGVNQVLFEKVKSHASATNQSIHPLSRVDFNAASGIVRAAKELGATQIVMGWNGRLTQKERLFGSVLDHVLEHAEPMVLVTKLIHPLNAFGRMVVVIPPHAEAEPGFSHWVDTLRALGQQTSSTLHLHANAASQRAVQRSLENGNPAVQSKVHEIADWEDFMADARAVTAQDLLIVVGARRDSVSYNQATHKIPYYLSHHFGAVSFMVLYPELVLSPAFRLV